MSTGCTTAFTSSPKSSFGTPNTATSATFGCVDQQVLRLLRIDVDAARDDHVGLAVGQVQVALGVDVADVAERGPALRAAGSRAVFSGSLWYSNGVAALEVDRARPRPAAAPCPRRRGCGACPAAGARPSPCARATPPSRSRRSRCPRCRRSTRRSSAPTTRSSAPSPARGRARRRGSRRAGSTDRGARARPRGSFSMRTNIVGTHCVCVTRWRSISVRNSAASKCSITTHVPPRRCTVMLKRSGAA